MKDESAAQSTPYQPKTPEPIAAGVYATALATCNTAEEFLLDFIATHATPSRLVARVILHPAHAKRLTRALQDNLSLYEKNFGALPVPPKPETTGSAQAQNIYSKLSIPDAVLAGSYANNVVIRHSREEFVLDFLAAFHPTPVVTARVLVSPGHLRRIVQVLEGRVRAYEEAFGKLKDPPASPEPPELPGPPPRFSLS